MKNKNVLFFSDTHGDISKAKEVIKYSSNIDMIIHLGDYVSDAVKIADETKLPTQCVKGNCDFDSAEAELKELFICGNKILITHGHNYGVKYSVDRLVYLAQEREAKAVFFGHTHISFCEYTEGVWVVNPGSISQPRSGCESYANVTFGKYGVIPKIMDFGRYI